MTKIKLTNRKAYNPSYHAEQRSMVGSGAGLNNNNGVYNNGVNNNGSELYRPFTWGTSYNDEYTDSQFQKPPARVPTRSICLASFLCFAGSLLLAFGFLVISGNLDGKFTDRIWPMVIMGFLMFIPGAYHVRIAYYAYKGIPGYSFDDIPEFE